MTWQYFNSPMMSSLVGPFGFFFWPLLVWSLVWKGMALWHAARKGETYWFVALLIVNTAGILEILYLYVFGGKKALSSPGAITSTSPKM